MSGQEQRQTMATSGPFRPVGLFCAGMLIVAVVYALPLLLAYARHGHVPRLADYDDSHYELRVVDAYRGGTLGNPFLAEYQHATRYLPELTERSFAAVAHATGASAQTVLTASRVVFPVLIFAALWLLARALDLSGPFALVAGLAAPLAPSLGAIFPNFYESGNPGWPRYFRLVSPAPHVFLMLAALFALRVTWAGGSLRWGAAAGAIMGLLFYTPFYYWSFALGGAAWLAFTATRRPRRALALSLAVAVIIGLPYAVQAFYVSGLRDVNETLVRNNLMLPGRWPQQGVLPRFFISFLFAICIWTQRRRLGELARFVLPFLFLGSVLFIENVVTNRHVQAWHWSNCLVPVWSLAAAALWQQWRSVTRPSWVFCFLALLSATALFNQVSAAARWEAWRHQQPLLYGLDERMPETLKWLSAHTPPASVVLADEEVMLSLPLLTHNKVYWSTYAGLHVVPESEVAARLGDMGSFSPSKATRLAYRADFYLGTDDGCAGVPADRLLYWNPRERTCVMALAPKQSGGMGPS